MQEIKVGQEIYRFPDEVGEDEIASLIDSDLDTRSETNKVEEEPEFGFETPLTSEDKMVFHKAGEYAGMAAEDLARFGRAESGFNFEANKGTRKAQGLMQFFPMAWTDAQDQLVKDGQDKLSGNDKYTARSAWAVAAYQRKYRSLLSDNPTIEERYALHLLGPTQFRKVMEGDGPLGDHLPASAIKNNGSLFPKGEKTTREELLKVITKKMDTGVGK